MAVTFQRDQIRKALGENDPNFSNYLDMQTGTVIRVNDTDASADAEKTRNQIMEGYGDRYRYIPGGNASAGDGDVAKWLEAEGL